MIKQGINYAVANVTGESIELVEDRGFCLADPLVSDLIPSRALHGLLIGTRIRQSNRPDAKPLYGTL